MPAFLTRMPAGIPGEVNRAQQASIEPIAVTPQGTTGAPTAFGIPMVIDQTAGNVGNARMVAAGDTLASIYGLLVRPFPAFSSQDALGTSTPPTQGPVDLLRRGYMSVKLSGATAAVKGGLVYIWTAAAGGGHIVGGFEAANPTTNGFAFTGATFMGPADANGNVEISFGLL